MIAGRRVMRQSLAPAPVDPFSTAAALRVPVGIALAAVVIALVALMVSVMR